MGNNSFDALIFDMDGTLWNATESYAAVWNECLAQMGMEVHVTASMLLQYMGSPIDVIFDGMLGTGIDTETRQRFLKCLYRLEEEMMPQLGGVLFDGVFDGLKRLHERYKLFMVSNCSANGLKNFMRFTSTTPFFTATKTYGENLLPKSDNIKLLVETYDLRNALYLGDTQGD
ncbi:MAG: HAD family hydrolase, partial [Muribaculaceae bacterium]|nr:HAD family hydrolase [Muribaculaceae bacterium]